jgi:DNA-binding MarR family transcriptional regulator
VISSATATDLVEALRTVVRPGRATRHTAHFGGLPGSSAATLVVLERDGEQRLGELAERLAVDPSVVSRQVAALTRMGLAARRSDPVDRRAQLLGITDAGRADAGRGRSGRTLEA